MPAPKLNKRRPPFGTRTNPSFAKSDDHAVVKAQTDGTLSALGGSPLKVWNCRIANATFMSLPRYASRDDQPDDRLPTAIAGLNGIAPTDVIEGMLAAQMIACHHASMECFRRATIQAQTFEGRSEALSQAGKLSRTYATLVEALNRHRGKGQQKVTVEHVHVHKGGQAIVGNVTRPGGGSVTKMEE